MIPDNSPKVAPSSEDRVFELGTMGTNIASYALQFYE